MMRDGEPLHSILARLGIAMTPEKLAYVAMDLVPSCLGAAVLDTYHGAVLLSLMTKNEYPTALKDQLAIAFSEMIDGREVNRLLGMFEELGRPQVIDEVRFTTGPITHDMARLHSDPTKVVVVVTPADANIRTTALNLGRVIETAVLMDV